MHVCVQVEARGRWRHLLPSFSTLIFELGSHIGTESSPVRRGWLSNKSQRSFISVSQHWDSRFASLCLLWRWNLRPHVHKAGSLPTEPSPLPYSSSYIIFFHVCYPTIESWVWGQKIDIINSPVRKKKTDYKGLFCFVPFCDNILECSPACLQTGNPSASLPWVTGVPGCRLRGFKDSEVETGWERILGILYCLSDPSAQKRERKSTSFLRLIHECLSYSSIYKIPNLGS